MKFVRAIWKLLVGIKDALVLIFMLMFFGLLYAGLSAGRRRSATAYSTSISTAAWSSSRPGANGPTSLAAAASSEYRLRDLVAALDKAKDDDRVKAVALDLDGFTGGGQTAIGDLADAIRRVRAVGQAGHRLCDRLHRRQLPARVRGVGNLAEPAGRGADRRAGRIEPLLQGPARQARRHRQRLSRRHLQSGGRAIHPQRHVARSEAELPGARQGAARNLARGASPGAAQGATSTFPTRHDRRGRRRPAATSPRRRSTPGWSTRSATGGSSRRGWPQLGGEDDGDRGGYKRIKLAAYVADAVDRRRAARSASSPSPA